MRIFINGEYRDMTEEELVEIEEYEHSPEGINAKIGNLKQQLAESDYKAIKHSEGLITDEEYAPIKAERQEIRDQINELESELQQ